MHAHTHSMFKSRHTSCAIVTPHLRSDDTNGRHMCVTKNAARFSNVLRENPQSILRCSNPSCLSSMNRPAHIDADGKPFRQFVSDAMYNLIQPVLEMHSKSLRLCRLPRCRSSERVRVWKEYRSANKRMWAKFRKLRVGIRNACAMIWGPRELTNKIETAAYNWSSVMYHLMQKYPGNYLHYVCE